MALQGNQPEPKLVGADTMDCEQPAYGKDFTWALDLARSAGLTINHQFGTRLSSAERHRLVSAFRSVVIPSRRPGRRRHIQITLAYDDWCSGMRGLALYSKHIGRWDCMSHWRRRETAKRLLNAIHTRHRRERKVHAKVNERRDGDDGLSA